MTDPHDFDELASAHLDGVTSPEEAALVDADPALQERVEELRALRAVLGEVPAVDPIRRDAAIMAALAAFDEEAAERDAATPVVPLAPRRRLSPTAVRVLSAAAVVAILALLVPLLTGIDGSGDDDSTSESAGEPIERAGDASNDSAEQAEPEASATTALGDVTVGGELGTYRDLDAMADAVAGGQIDSRAFRPQTGQALAEEQLCSSDPPAGTRVSTAVVAGEAVIVWLRLSPEGRSVLTVLRADGCEVIEEREL